MLFKLIVIFAVATVASAIPPGYVSSPYALGSQAEHTIRGYGGLSSVSKQAKVINSPYSTVQKTDIRLTNDAGYAAHPAVTGLAYGTPAIATHGYGAPAYHGYHHAPALAHGYHGAPVTAIHGYHQSPAALTYAHPGYATAPAAVHHAPLGYAAAHHQPVHHALPTYAKGVVPSGLGVAYSPATSVATATFNGYGVHYGY